MSDRMEWNGAGEHAVETYKSFEEHIAQKLGALEKMKRPDRLPDRVTRTIDSKHVILQEEWKDEYILIRKITINETMLAKRDNLIARLKEVGLLLPDKPPENRDRKERT